MADEVDRVLVAGGEQQPQRGVDLRGGELLAVAAAVDVTRESEPQRIRRVSAALPADVPDNLFDVATRICGDCDFGGPFELGLDLMLRGLR